MELNNIQQQGTWAEQSARLNENFYKIDIAVATLDRATRKNKGYYANYLDLKTYVPYGKAGDIAFVGENYPYNIYRWNASQDCWVDTFEQGGDVSVDLAAYYTSNQVDNLLEQEAELRQQVAQELRDKIAYEESLRKAADNSTNDYITDVQKNLQTALESEIARAKEQESNLSSSIESESQRATDAEDELRSLARINKEYIDQASKSIAYIKQNLMNDGTVYEYLNGFQDQSGGALDSNMEIRLPFVMNDYKQQKQGVYVSVVCDIDGQAYGGENIALRVRIGNNVYGASYTLTQEDLKGVPSIILTTRIPFATISGDCTVELVNNTSASVEYYDQVICPYDVNNIRDIVNYHERRIQALEADGGSGGGGGTGGGSTDITVISKAYMDMVFEGIIAPPTTEWVV